MLRIASDDHHLPLYRIPKNIEERLIQAYSSNLDKDVSSQYFKRENIFQASALRLALFGTNLLISWLERT